MASWLGMLLAVIAVFPAAAISPIEPKSTPVLAKSYQDCMRMVGRDAKGAMTFAQNWRARGGGEAATHCQAAADFALGDFAGAGTLLDALARTSDATQPERGAALYRQAARAWTAARQPDKALVSITRALALLPDDVDLLTERAEALVDLERTREAVDDLDRAIEKDPNRADILIYRATALRRLKALAGAESDLDHALALDPKNAEALLERGVVRRLRGDLGGARQDWEAIGAWAPKTPANDKARTYLAELDQMPVNR